MSDLNSNHKKGKRPEIPWDGVPKYQFLSSIEGLITGLTATFTDPDVILLSKEVTKYCKTFSDTFYEKTAMLKPYMLKEFADACKNRCDDLTNLLGNLSVINEEFEIFLVYKELTAEITTLKYISGSSTVFAAHATEEEIIEVYTIQRNPKWYRPLFVGVLKCVELAHRRSSYSRKSYEDCIRLANILIGVGRLYLEFRSNEDMIHKQELEAIATMSSGTAPKLTAEYLELYNQVVHDIKEGVLPYIKRFRNAMDATEDIRNSPYNDDDYFVSAKSATTRLRSMQVKKQISFLNSCFERDPFLGHAVHQVIGYVSSYNTEVPDDYVENLLKACSIDQHKYKRRVIKMAINAIQDICNYIHHRAASFLRALTTDCTDDQERGVSFVARVTSPQYRAKMGWPSIYCTDIKDATGTISQEFELMVMEILWKPEIIQFWRDVLALPQKFFLADGTSQEFIQRVGQPQGLAGSFELFAIDHHIMMLMVMKRSGRENIDSQEFYRLLGDDDAINTVTPDPDEQVLSDTQYVYGGANWLMELGKCKITRHTDKVAIGEFAKVTIINGAICSPPPTRLMGRYSHPTQPTYAITTCLWMQTHGYNAVDSIEILLDQWFSYKEEDRKIADIFLRGGLSKHFNCFKHPDLKTSDPFRMKVAFAYLITKIRGTFVESLLSKDDRNNLLFQDKPLPEALSALFGSNPEFWTDMITNPDHKASKLLRKNIAIQDALVILLEDPNVTFLAAGLNLSERERNTIQIVSELLDNYRLMGELGEQDFVIIRNQLEDIESFNRFQLRSITKAGGREASYLAEVIRLFHELFPNNEKSELELQGQ